MKVAKWAALAASVGLFGAAEASGFGLYEASAKTYALGGAVVGRAVDASANFHNPATLSDLTNATFTLGFTTQHPRCRIKVDGAPSTAMNPGAFVLPHIMAAVPLPADFTFGLGVMPEYGLGSEYDQTFELVNSSQETTVESFTVNPNLAYRITDDWSVGAGLRLFYFDFEQYSQPVPGRVYHRLKGNNRMADMGWHVGTRYRILDNLSAGLVYKSKTVFNVRGNSVVDGAASSWDAAETDLEMPDSVSAGLNWDITDRWHLGLAFIWTQWSTLGTLDFRLGQRHVPCKLEWEDTYRFAIAPSWDFAEDWTWMASYAYETDCTGDQDSTMLPRADRHMVTTGVAWECFRNFELALSYGVIIMDGNGTSQASDMYGNLHEYRAYRGISHAVSFSLSYRF